eukprot:m51a1_g12788 hypothetical protein (309) ;mRNA; f:20-1190
MPANAGASSAGQAVGPWQGSRWTREGEDEVPFGYLWFVRSVGCWGPCFLVKSGRFVVPSYVRSHLGAVAAWKGFSEASDAILGWAQAVGRLYCEGVGCETLVFVAPKLFVTRGLTASDRAFPSAAPVLFTTDEDARLVTAGEPNWHRAAQVLYDSEQDAAVYRVLDDFECSRHVEYTPTMDALPHDGAVLATLCYNGHPTEKLIDDFWRSLPPDRRAPVKETFCPEFKTCSVGSLHGLSPRVPGLMYVDSSLSPSSSGGLVLCVNGHNALPVGTVMGGRTTQPYNLATAFVPEVRKMIDEALACSSVE